MTEAGQTTETLVLPPPVQTAVVTMADGSEIVLRRYGVAGSTRLVLSHGNGLAIDAYAPFWLPFVQDFDVVVFDIRNHGHNRVHRPENHTWSTIFEDFETLYHGIRREFGEARTVGIFHSLSAIAALQHTLSKGKRWDALALFDPPIAGRAGHPLAAHHFADMTMMEAKAKRRATHYPSLDLFARQISRLPSFARLVPEAPMLLASATLRETADGRFELRNPRELEARLYITQDDATLWPRMRDLKVPTILIAGDPAVSEGPASKICGAIHAEIGTEFVSIPDTTHFLQTEKPQACREAVMAFLKRHSLVD
jgi:pimeloyl-ACP methyl ester carboxylesterase